MPAFKKLADKSAGPRFDERTGQPRPWPCLGLLFVEPGTQQPLDEPPAKMTIGENAVEKFVEEGLMTLVNERIVTAPGGPPRNPNAKIFTFRQADELLVHTLDQQGQKVDARYAILRNPGKYPCTEQEYLASVPEKHRPKTAIVATTVVHHTYECELIGVEPAKVVAA